MRLRCNTLGGYGTVMAGYEMSKDDLLARMRRIEGQVRGIARMIEQDQYCIDVLTQVSAATKGLQGVALGLFDDHLRHCVSDAVASGGPDAQRKLTEATTAVERLLKS
jgi:CsoR family transcriptional regulator, copper-sensing transcriptional repressor